MKKRTLKINIGVLIVFIMVSIIIAVTMFALPKLKNTKVELAKGQVDEIEASYANESEEAVDKTWDVSADGDGSVMAKLSISDKTLTISGNGVMKNGVDTSDVMHREIDTNIIEKVIIENGVTGVNGGLFNQGGIRTSPWCSNLKKIEINSDNENYTIENGVLYSKDKTELVYYPAGKEDKTFEIPSSVKSINGWAFGSCDNLDEVMIPYSVTAIKEGAFQWASLKKITIPYSITNIESSTFYSCRNLKEVTIQNGIQEIKSQAFGDCFSLEEINIPRSVTKIGTGAFSGNFELKTVTIPSSETVIGYNAFDNCNQLTIYCKIGGSAYNFAKQYNIAFAEITIIKANVTYSTTTPTNQDVTVTIVTSQPMQEVGGWVLSADKKSLTRIYKTNTSSKGETIDIRDSIGNGPDEPVIVKITNIDKTPPTVNVKYSTTEPTNQNVIATITANETLQRPEGWTLSEDKKTLTKEYSANTSIDGEKIDVKDSAGNSAQEEVIIKITNIDKKAPETNIQYSTTDPTNQNVIATITANEAIQNVEGWNLSEDKKILTKEYSTNTSAEGEKVVVKDLAGNSAEEEIIVKVTNIDKEVPKVSIRYSITEPTNQNVIVTITANEALQNVDGWNLSEDKKILTKEYTENTPEEGEKIEVKDLAGNSTEEETIVKITNIDKIAPIAEVNYYPNSSTDENVTVTIKANEPIQEVEGWDLSEDKTTLAKIYVNNKTEEIEIKDLVGNSQKVIVKITNIVRDMPTVEIKYSTTSPTNQNVTVTIRANKEIQNVNGWNLSEDKTTLTKEYTANTSAEGEKIIVKDLAGNTTKEDIIIKITNIDKTAPEANIEYSTTTLTNQDVIATITSDEKIQGVEGWELSADKKTLTKKYTANETESVTIKDLVGNSTTVSVKIENIDKEAPTVSIEYTPTSSTNQNVTVTITANEKVQQIEGWTISEDEKKLTKTYAVNQKETIKIIDLAGNITTKEIIVDNIYKTEVQARVKYSTTLKTNKNVEVTIIANKKVKQVSGWTISNDGKTLTKIYESNNTETITLQDEAGNTKIVQINVENIDKVKPLVQIKYNTELLTNQNVIVTITSNKEIQEVEGWNLSEDKKTLTKEYMTNTSTEGEKIDIKDLAGNTTEKDVIIKVNNIDKIVPELDVKYNVTTEGVKVTITANEKIQKVEGWELSQDQKSLTKTYLANKEEAVIVYDMAGNETKTNIRITNIADKTTEEIETETKTEMTQKDDTLATQVIPKAGQKKRIVIILIAVTILLMILGIKNKKYKDIK